MIPQLRLRSWQIQNVNWRGVAEVCAALVHPPSVAVAALAGGCDCQTSAVGVQTERMAVGTVSGCLAAATANFTQLGYCRLCPQLRLFSTPGYCTKKNGDQRCHDEFCLCSVRCHSNVPRCRRVSRTVHVLRPGWQYLHAGGVVGRVAPRGRRRPAALHEPVRTWVSGQWHLL